MHDRRDIIQLLLSTVGERTLAKEFSFSTGDVKYPHVGLHSEVIEIGSR